MNQTEVVLQELKGILESTRVFRKVSLEKVKPITEEDVFPSVYIGLYGEGYKPNGIKTSSLKGYDVALFVELTINARGDDYLDIKGTIEKAILNDSKLWNEVLDRDLIKVEYDTNQYLPKKSFSMLVQLVYRTCGN
jgi:hypothetical protein